MCHTSSAPQRNTHDKKMSQQTSRFVLLLLALKTVTVSTQICEHVDNFKLLYRDADTRNDDWNNIILTGCISDKSFNRKKVTLIYSNCQETSITKLEKNFIHNMQDLKEIKIGKCYVDTIEPGAFSNLPKLVKVDMYLNRFKTVPVGVFNVLPTLRVIYLVDNRLTHIEDNAFSNLPNLKEILLQKGTLTEMRREWFTNTSNIERCSLYHNSIRKVPAGMFHGWKKLKFINLNSNAISVIEGPIFKNNSPQVRNLDFHHNRLTQLPPDMLSDEVFLKHFSVSANLLNYIPEVLLRKIRAANMVIFSNPFTCPCLDKINEILFSKRVTVDARNIAYVAACKDRDVAVCGAPTNFSKTCDESVDTELTKKIVAQMKSVGYDAVYDPNGQQCAMFDAVD